MALSPSPPGSVLGSPLTEKTLHGAAYEIQVNSKTGLMPSNLKIRSESIYLHVSNLYEASLGKGISDCYKSKVCLGCILKQNMHVRAH